MENIIGHKRNIEWLEKTHLDNAWSHSYLFIGPSMIGKRLVAQRAFELISGKEFNPDDPDILVLGGQEGSLSIEEIRKAREFLSLKPYSSPRQCIIVENASDMTEEASNAFLKTLEEPSSAIIFLMANSRLSVPQTIASRCQSVFFSTLNENEMTEFLKDRKLSKEQLEFLIKASGGRPGWAQRLIDSKSLKKIMEYTSELVQIFSYGPAEKIAFAKDLYESEEYIRVLESFMFINLNKENVSSLNRVMNSLPILKDSRYNHRLAIENMLLSC